MSLKPKVALSQDFLMNLSKLPSGVQSKVMKWAILFQSNPKSTSINYENIHAASDANMKSVRIDGDWRGIVFKPDQGDVYVLLHVNKHDEAYRWAERRKLIINPVTGAMQMIQVEDAAATAEPFVAAKTKTSEASSPAAAEKSKPYADGVSDHDLMALGVPPDLLDRIKVLGSEAELDALQSALPVEAYEALFLLAAGDTAEQILNARETRVDRQIDTTNFEAALETPESQSRFVVVDDEAMVAIMNAPLAQWRVFCTRHSTSLLRVTAVGRCVYWAAQALARPWWRCTAPNGWPKTAQRASKRSCSRPSPKTWHLTSKTT